MYLVSIDPETAMLLVTVLLALLEVLIQLLPCLNLSEDLSCLNNFFSSLLSTNRLAI